VTIEPGQQLLHYRLTEKLGEGGMGVVWKATDTTLDRDVAIKVLPPDFAADAERLARFDREARLLASLNHPNIAGIFGIHKAEATDGRAETHFLAMELVAGEDLSESLINGPLPVEQALRTAREIATGLEAAHENGVIHRDLKPANVKLTTEGQSKVLDFGLAKAADAATASGDPSLSPTMTSAGTQAGMILGTASYMSPEQAAGQPVDRRCDIWSFGVLLHELLTGKRLFDGETVSHTLAAVLRADVDLADLPKQTPVRVEQLIRRCLERDPTRRLRDIGEARILLDDLLSGGADEARPEDSAVTPTQAGKGRFAWMTLALVSLAALAVVGFWPTETPQLPRVQSTLVPPLGWDFAPGAPFAVSQDGRHVAFVAHPRSDNEEVASGSVGIWVRDLASAESRRLIDADVDAYPFWSPDGRWIGFFAGGKLNKIEVGGGPVIPICDGTNDGRGGTWSESGTIIFQREWNEGLMKVAAGGGTPEPLTTLDKDRFDIGHRWPELLPDGRHFLFYVVSTSNPVTSEHSGIYVGSLDSEETRFLLKSESRALYAGGHLLYRVGSTLMAHRFDPSTLTLTGDPAPVATDVTGGAISWGGAQFGVSENLLIHQRGAGSADTVLQWRDHDGNVLESIDEADGYWDATLSHDGSRLAIAIGQDTTDIWIYDLERDSRTRFSYDTAIDRFPLWSPDDSRLAYRSSQKSEGEIWIRPTSGQGEAQLVYSVDTSIILTDWSRDGKSILFDYVRRADDDEQDVWLFDTQTMEARPYLTGKFTQREARLSPDGRWVAYSSNESGADEVYVQAFPESEGRWVVSNDGGTRGAFTPVWGDDGRELFYRRGNSVLALPVTSGAGLAFGTPRRLFGLISRSGEGSALVVTDNGQRILCNELPPTAPGESGARLIQNWSTALVGK